MRKYLRALLIVGLVVALSGCASSGADSSQPESDAGKEAAVESTTGAALAEPKGIAPSAFGSATDSWHDSLTTIDVDGETLTVHVNRQPDAQEFESIKATAKLAGPQAHIAVKRAVVVLDVETTKTATPGSLRSGKILSDEAIK